MKSGEPRDKKCHKNTFRLFNFEILLWALGTLVFLKLSFWFKIILYFSSGLWTRSVRPIFFLNEPCLFRVFEICEITVVGEKKSPLADAKSELLLPISNRLRPTTIWSGPNSIFLIIYLYAFPHGVSELFYVSDLWVKNKPETIPKEYGWLVVTSTFCPITWLGQDDLRLNIGLMVNLQFLP